MTKEALVKIQAASVKEVKGKDLAHSNMYEYGTYVIEDRVVQDVRDGLKPVQRRVLQAMLDVGALQGGKTHKSAKIVGQAMGMYHPHGDASIYQTLVNMVNAQTPLVEGQGNFGSLTDNAAASRYTEARMSKIGMQMFACNEVMQTVPNYTGESQEPVVIPTRLPVYFMNGGEGIGVGMACKMPSHNLEEIVGAMKYLIKRGEAANTKGLVKYLKAPDYKYGGNILSDEKELYRLYKDGKGKVRYSCEYSVTKSEKKGGLLITISGYCPGFNPENFLLAMNKLIDEKYVISANDATVRAKKGEQGGDKLEVEVASLSLFNKYVKPKLETSLTYNFYALEREKLVDDPNKDIKATIHTPNMIELMRMWIDWRRDVETQVLKKALAKAREKLFREKLRLEAASNIKIVMSSIDQNKMEPRDYLVKNLPMLKEVVKEGKKEKAFRGADYILGLTVLSLKKADLGKQKENVKSTLKEISSIKKDLDNIDGVILSYLDQLKPFFQPRKLKLPGSYQAQDLSKMNKLAELAIASITADGKKENNVTVKGSSLGMAHLVATDGEILMASSDGEAIRMAIQEFTGKDKDWSEPAGLASGDCHRFLFRTTSGKVLIVDNDGADYFTAVKLKEGEKVKRMDGIYKGSKMIAWSNSNQVKVVDLDKSPSTRKNSAAKGSGTGFKNIKKAIICHKGCLVFTTDGKMLEPEQVTKQHKVVGIAGDTNFIIYKNGKREVLKQEEVKKAASNILYCVPMKFKGRKPLEQ